MPVTRKKKRGAYAFRHEGTGIPERRKLHVHAIPKYSMNITPFILSFAKLPVLRTRTFSERYVIYKRS